MDKALKEAVVRQLDDGWGSMKALKNALDQAEPLLARVSKEFDDASTALTRANDALFDVLTPVSWGTAHGCMLLLPNTQP
jgi:hypothetical protein